MPYKKVTKGNQVCVVNSDTGEEKACYSGKDASEKADRALAAFYANVPDAKKEAGDESLDKEALEKCGSMTYVPYGVNTFSQLDRYREAREKARDYENLVYTLEQLISNVMYDAEISDKTKALSALMDEFISRVEMERKEKSGVPDEVGNPTKEELDTRLAQIEQAEDTQKEKRLLRQAYRALGEEIPDQIKGIDDAFVLWKEEDGTYRFAAIYSNNYEDSDEETIAEKSHQASIQLANEGVIPMPELWQWHIPGTKWGQVDHLMYEDGFSLAFGHVDPGHEKEAELLATKDNVGVSHGMPKSSILRDPDDPSVIVFHISREISPLPLNKAANKLTGFTVFSEEIDEMKKEKKEWLASLGYSEDQIKEIEQRLTTHKETAEDQGIQSKEGDEKVTQEAPQEQADASPADSGEAATQQEQASTKGEEAPDLKELMEAMVVTMKPLADAVKEIKDRVETLSTRMEGFEQKVEVKAKQTVDETPALSLKELFAQAVWGDGSAQIDGRSALAKDGPAENKEEEGFAVTGIPVLDKAIRANLVNA